MNFKNSLDSSLTVMSAPRVVSKTLSKPMRFRAATMRPMEFFPSSAPSLRPMATLTAGAIWTVEKTFLSKRSLQTASMEFLTDMAPVGQTAEHWPQPTQGDSERGAPKAVATFIPEPLKAKSMAPTFWISLQTLMQSPQSMHLLLSMEMEAEDSSGIGA